MKLVIAKLIPFQKHVFRRIWSSLATPVDNPIQEEFEGNMMFLSQKICVFEAENVGVFFRVEPPLGVPGPLKS